MRDIHPIPPGYSSPGDDQWGTLSVPGKGYNFAVWSMSGDVQDLHSLYFFFFVASSRLTRFSILMFTFNVKKVGCYFLLIDAIIVSYSTHVQEKGIFI